MASHNKCAIPSCPRDREPYPEYTKFVWYETNGKTIRYFCDPHYALACAVEIAQCEKYGDDWRLLTEDALSEHSDSGGS